MSADLHRSDALTKRQPCRRDGSRPRDARARLVVNSIPVPESGCWLWLGRTSKKGYGVIVFEGRRMHASRASYIAFVGPADAGLCVCHKCDVPSCVNPAHLYLGTHKDNANDRTVRNRGYRHPLTSHCVNGHPRTDENTSVSVVAGRTKRTCRICRREAQLRSYRKLVRRAA